jgi:hypothetical protein
MKDEAWPGDDDEEVLELLGEFTNLWADGQASPGEMSKLRKETGGDFNWDDLERKGGFPWFSPHMCHCVRPVFLEEHEKLHGKGTKLSRTSVRALLMTLQLQQQSGSSAGPVALVDDALLDQIFHTARERFFAKPGDTVSSLTFDQFFCTLVSDFMFGSPLPPRSLTRSDDGVSSPAVSPNIEELQVEGWERHALQSNYDPLPDTARVCVPTGNNALRVHEGELFKKSNSFLRSKRHMCLNVSQAGLFFFASAKKKTMRHKVELSEVLTVGPGSWVEHRENGTQGTRTNSTTAKDATGNFSLVVVTKTRTFELCCPNGPACMDWVSALCTHCLMNTVDKMNDVNRVKSFIDQGGNVNISTVAKGTRPLILMAYVSKQTEVVKELLRSNADIRSIVRTVHVFRCIITIYNVDIIQECAHFIMYPPPPPLPT